MQHLEYWIFENLCDDKGEMPWKVYLTKLGMLWPQSLKSDICGYIKTDNSEATMISSRRDRVMTLFVSIATRNSALMISLLTMCNLLDWIACFCLCSMFIFLSALFANVRFKAVQNQSHVHTLMINCPNIYQQNKREPKRHPVTRWSCHYCIQLLRIKTYNQKVNDCRKMCSASDDYTNHFDLFIDPHFVHYDCINKRLFMSMIKLLKLRRNTLYIMITFNTYSAPVEFEDDLSTLYFVPMI